MSGLLRNSVSFVHLFIRLSVVIYFLKFCSLAFTALLLVCSVVILYNTPHCIFTATVLLGGWQKGLSVATDFLWGTGFRGNDSRK